MQLSHVAQQLRRHVDIEVNQLDITATLEKTVRAAGWLTPVTTVIKQLPEYLVLIDKITFSDHQTQWVDTLLNQLVEEGVFVNRYYFDTDPRHCHPQDNQRVAFTLKELAEHYAHCRLLIFSDGNGLIEPFSGQVVPWIEQFSVWSQRVLLTFIPPNQWGYKEELLENNNFLLLPTNKKGLQVLAERLETRHWQPYVGADDNMQPLPKTLQRFPYRWLERKPPESAELSELLKQLQNFLGQKGYYWFSACAVYPELRWPLTLYLGDKLKLLTIERLTRLARLPWFRYGYMPNWLRERLIRDLLKGGQEKVIRELVEEVLKKATPNKLGDSFHFIDIVMKPFKNISDDAASLGHVFLSFVRNRLSVKVPQELLGQFRRVLDPMQILRNILFTTDSQQNSIINAPKSVKKRKWPLILSAIIGLLTTAFFWQPIYHYLAVGFGNRLYAEELMTVNNLEYTYYSKHISGEHELQDGSVLYSGDQYFIEFTPDEDGYVYIYHWSANNSNIFDIINLVGNEIYKVTGKVTYYIPSSNVGPPKLDDIVGKETICLIAFKQRNPYLESLAIEKETSMVKSNTTILKQYLKNICSPAYSRTFQHKATP